MGTYVYLYTRTPKCNAYLPSGEKVTLSHYKYAFKPYLYDDGPRVWKMWEARSADTFAGRDHKEYAYQGDKPYDGAPVYTSLLNSAWYDCQDFPGILAGWLEKHGKHWYVVTKRTESHVTHSIVPPEPAPSVKVTTYKMVAPGMFTYQLNDGPEHLCDCLPYDLIGFHEGNPEPYKPTTNYCHPSQVCL